ncbi:hypothetical protein GCM10010441_75430 [Kitasatospora paracochleata]|uniref:ABC transmembrane type-1 domain-containing protein n=1 Tax=Kitasatospora paracochleata TaxID=58354 RepID=A0ABT1J9X2_9ACTN|nr:hypothetical protein [Kitasatospora paracochleata]MCP2314256.1 hypothetical protein [Kitasatospora paracochleata]
MVELVIANGRLLAWQAARHLARQDRRRRMPPLRRYIDPSADLAAGLSRIALGAVTGWLLHSQVTGLYAAVAAGASAPALLRQIGSFTTVRSVLQGEDPPSATVPGEQTPVVVVPVGSEEAGR